MNELEAAQQVRDGLLPSGTRFANAALFAIRISGSGMAERPAHGEQVYRPAEIWTSAEMLARASGLAVVLGHPPGGTLTSDEYAARTIGSIVLPYAVGSELWGIARIMDSDAAVMMASGAFSTSPSASFAPGDAVAVGNEGGVLLIERNPTLLDHVAIVPNVGDAGGGVWDKGQPGTGIRSDSFTKDKTTMADDTPAGDDNGLGPVMAALNALTTMCASMGVRLDAIEQTGKKVDAEPSAPLFTAADERKDEGDKASAQARADAVAQAFGERAPAPLSGERTLAYRQRLAQRFQRHCPAFNDVALATINDAVLFGGVEEKIYADAMVAALKPEVMPGQPLRAITRENPQTGQRVTTFHGAHTIFSEMAAPSMRVTRFYDARPGDTARAA